MKLISLCPIEIAVLFDEGKQLTSKLLLAFQFTTYDMKSSADDFVSYPYSGATFYELGLPGLFPIAYYAKIIYNDMKYFDMLYCMCKFT
ncbi:MAG: hypothetical protein ABIQ74_13105 [Chitinophagales bacterium]